MKRIIAIMAAVVLAAVMLNIKVSADSVNGGITSGGGGSGGSRTDYGNVLEAYTNGLGELANGEITIDEFLEISGKIIDESEDEFADRMGYGYINDMYEDYLNGFWTNVANAEDLIRDVLNPYSSTTTQNTTDLKGGSCAIRYENNSQFIWYYANCTGIIYSDGRYSLKDIFWHTWGYRSTQKISYDNSYVQNEINVMPNTYSKVEIFGDWVYSDGSQASTNDEFVDIPTYDFSNASDKELEELLKNLNETLKRENPDLSTMEGLLESIYYRLGKLDSDNDNALLSDINTAILALSQSNDENASNIIIALGEIKNAINGMSGDLNDSLDDLGNGMDKLMDFEIPDELLNIDFDSLSDTLKGKIDDVTSLIYTLVSKGIPMAAIDGGLLFYQDIIFNASDPQDIVFDLNFNGETYSFTILSTSFFTNEAMQALLIVRNLVSFMLGYAWVLAMRKKAVNMMN